MDTDRVHMKETRVVPNANAKHLDHTNTYKTDWFILRVRRDQYGNIIGAGEDTAISILHDIYINAKIIPQYPLVRILTDEYKDSLSESYLKHKIDIMIFTPTRRIAVRVQGKDHAGVLKSARDTVQKKLLEWHNCIVVDLLWVECPTLFAEKKDKNSYVEVTNSLKSAGLYP